MKRVAIEAELASALINASQRLPSYKSGGDRFHSRTQVSLKSGSSGWVEQDINTLFKKGNYIFTIPVKGKTADYLVSIEVVGFLSLWNKELEDQPFTSNTIQRVIQKAISINKIKVSCTCPDFVYRYSYSLSLSDSKTGDLESRPSVKTNPTYQKGVCKHIISVLSNKSWIPQIATNLHTYILNIYNTNKQLFDSSIRPALNDITDDKILNKPATISQDASASEAVNTYYSGSKSYDDDQNLMIAISKEAGADVQIYITPENTPEQILELSNSYKLGIEPEFMLKLSNPLYSPQTIKVLTKAKKSGLNWERYSNIHPDILEYILTKHIENGISIDDLELDGLSLQQVRTAVTDKLRRIK